ncbi:LytR C-terminal domain-containing protein [Micromonospora sp. NPDC049559]|uniref:LytR C-terminal domain-containing protein n=1 Tax=Micromonospora sp. NPDC049559 TaxID=3155923 RepID=UPI0034304408
MRALVVVGALVVCALIFVVVAIVRDSQGGQVSAENCPKGFKLANLTLPDEKDVKINVYNGTNEAGLATGVGNDFKNRKFQVLKTGNDPKKKGYDGVAVLRYGPKSIGAATLLQAYFLRQAENDFDINRDDDVIDVVIGGAFQQLATPTEKNQSLGDIGRPSPEPGTCPSPDKDS